MATAKNTVTISINMEELEALVAELVAKELEGKIPALETPAKEEEAPAKTKGKAPAKGKAAKAKAEEPAEEEEDDEEEEDEEEDEDADGVSREDLEAMTLTALRKVARTDYELTAADYKGMDKDALIDLILETADGVEDEEEDEDEDEEEGELSRKEELEAMSEKELRKIAIGLGFDKADVKEADKETLVESILDDEASESDEDEDAEGDGGEDEAGDDEDWEGYTKEDLNGMSLAELREIAEEWELVVRAGTKKAGLVKLILEAQEDEEDEDDE